MPNQYKPLDLALLQSMLAGSVYSGRIIYKERLDSTNRYARLVAEQGYAEGTVVVTEFQSAGKGRMSRRWLARAKTNLLFSVVLRPEQPLDTLFALNAVASVSVVKAVRDQCGLETRIKWPNDIYWLGKSLTNTGRKLGGLLGEFSVNGTILLYVIIGVGLNVNWAPPQLSPGAVRATSIRWQIGRMECRTRLLARILRYMERYYWELKSGHKRPVLEAYKENSAILGRQVKVVEDNEAVVGRATDIMGDGTLIIIDEQGRKRAIRWGDVSLRLVGK